jgi:chromate transporter
MSPAELLDLLLHFASLSMLAIGGALGLAPEMRRYLVDEHALISGTQFTEAIVIAQAAPGPNILFVTLLGWQAGGGWGALATTVGLLAPSSVFTWWAARFKRQREHSPWVEAIRIGLSPIAIGLTAAAGWVVSEGNNGADWRLWALGFLAMVIVLSTRINMLWLIFAGALAGIMLQPG